MRCIAAATGQTGWWGLYDGEVFAGMYIRQEIDNFGQKIIFVGEMYHFICTFGIIIVPLQPKFVGE